MRDRHRTWDLNLMGAGQAWGGGKGRAWDRYRMKVRWAQGGRRVGAGQTLGFTGLPCVRMGTGMEWLQIMQTGSRTDQKICGMEATMIQYVHKVDKG